MSVTERISDILLKLSLMAAASAVSALLLRDILAISLHVPLDPDEGWNAFYAAAAIAGRPLYPHGLMTNNYPPLSFYLVGALARLTGDAVIAGRILSLVAFAACSMGLMALLRQLGASVLASLFAGLFFAGVVLIASDYVAMDDPQLLGHAIQIQALLLLLRPKPESLIAALLMTVSLFVKHNLVAMPLAGAIWLFWRDPREAKRFMLAGIVWGLSGLLAIRLVLDANLLREIFSPRLYSLATAETNGLHFLAWAAAPILIAIWLTLRFPQDKWVRFAALYAGLAIIVGAGLSGGDGVDANIYFDAAIALSLTGGLALCRFAPRYSGMIALACAIPLGLMLKLNFHDDNFAYKEAFRRQAQPDIVFFALRPGPALCEDLALCYWAGKDATVDVFNAGEAVAAHAQSSSALVTLFDAETFSAMQFYSLKPFALGAEARAALLAHYRVDHEDDNGVFLVRRRSGAPGPS